MDITTHPFLNVLWTCFVIFIWIAWFWLLIAIITDLFRRHDMAGFAKAMWVIFIVFLPLFGALIYLISNGGSMGERNVAAARAQQAETDEYIRQTAGSGGSAAEIERAKALLDSGAITEAEFQAMKARALG